MEKHCIHCGKEIENIQDIKYCPYCGEKPKKIKKPKTEKSPQGFQLRRKDSNSYGTTGFLASFIVLIIETFIGGLKDKEKALDEETGVYVSKHFLERFLDLIQLVAYLTIVLYPFAFVLRDVIDNKFIHSNKEWIRRAKRYYLLLIAHYIIIMLCLSVWTGSSMGNSILYSAILCYGINALIWKFDFVIYFYFIDRNHEAEVVPQEEIEKARQLQIRDEDESNFWKIRKIYLATFLVSFYLVYEIIFKTYDMPIYEAIFVFEWKYVILLVVLGLIANIIPFDIAKQIYLKRNTMELFWKKRILFYIIIALAIFAIFTLGDFIF